MFYFPDFESDTKIWHGLWILWSINQREFR